MDKTSMSALWEKHLECEFTTRDTEATLATMVEDAYVNHVPVLTGGVGKEQLREFLRTFRSAQRASVSNEAS